MLCQKLSNIIITKEERVVAINQTQKTFGSMYELYKNLIKELEFESVPLSILVDIPVSY